MNPTPVLVVDRDEMLVAELHRLGVRHLARLKVVEPPPDPLPPAVLIAGLVASDEARLQASLIPLFLHQPAYSQHLPDALTQLSNSAATEVKLYYQAAVYLQTELEPILREHLPEWQPLPDLFSSELGLPALHAVEAEVALCALGERHCQLSGWNCNWSGSYRQNIPRLLKHLQHDNRHHEPGTIGSLSQ